MPVKMYFIAHVLPEDLNQKVLSYKNMMLERFECKVGLKSPAHITLVAPYWMEDELEDDLQNDIDELYKPFTPFSILTADFSAFKPRTIYISIAKNEQLEHLKSATDLFFYNKPVYKAKIENRPFHPHITIATRDLYKKTFYEAWSIFEHQRFREQWMATGISLLRHNTRNWDVIHTSWFKENKQ